MKQTDRRNFLMITLLLVISLALPSCGGTGSRTESTSSSPVGEQSDPNLPTWFENFPQTPLPDDFPADFPIPEGALTGESDNEPGEGGLAAMLALPLPLEEALAYYRQALPAEGWTVTDDYEGEDGADLLIESATLEGELYFVPMDGGSVVDISLRELGAGFDIPEIEDVTGGTPDPNAPDVGDFGEWEEMGETGSGIPADLPLPPGTERIELTEELAAKGYVLVFRYQDQPELTLAMFTTSLASGGWEILDAGADVGIRLYQIPFSDPATGFRGTALITNNSDQTGIESPDWTVIAIKPD